jgi:hypothetical protein
MPRPLRPGRLGVATVEPRVLLRVALVTALGGLFLGACAAAVGIPKAQVTVGVVLRGVFVLVLLALVVPAVLNGLMPAVDQVRLPTSVLVGAALGYLLDPLSWGGHAFVAQLLFDPGLVACAVDAVLWVAVTWAAAMLRVRSSQTPSGGPGRGRSPGYLT